MAAILGACALVVAIRVPFDPMTVASGVYRHGKASINKGDEVPYYRDGKTASVAVLLSKSGAVSISTNGKTDAAVQMTDQPPTPDEPTMVLLGGVPLSLHDAPKKVGIIGFGSGMTTHTVLGDNHVEKIDTIEIEPAMVEGAKAFGPRVERAYQDKRSHIVIDDAKAYFAGQNKKYDILISEPSNPWISGVGSLFSKEFYKFVPRYLNDDGLFVQWIQLYEIDDALLASILNSLTPAFEDYAAWFGSQTDLIIVAKPNGRINDVDWKRIASSPNLVGDLSRVGVTQEAHLAFRKVSNATMIQALGKFSGQIPSNSDYYPILSLEAPRARFKNSMAGMAFELQMSLRTHLEALNISYPLPSKTPTLGDRYFLPEASTANARALIAEIKGDAVAQTPAVIAMRTIGAQCSVKWSEGELRTLSRAMGELAKKTIGFLPRDALVGAWINPSWQKCLYVPQDLQRAMRILEAYANRDYSKLEKFSMDWFTQRPSSPFFQSAFDSIAWMAWSTALVGQKRWGQLAEMSSAQFANTNFSPEEKIAHGIIHNFALQLSIGQSAR